MIAATSAKPATSCGSRRTHQMPLSRSGTALIRGANWKLSPAASASRLLTRATSTRTTRKSTNCTRPVSVV